MIKEIILKNFEAHKYFRTKLDPLITSFVGASDAGKSSILRGIKWVATNRYNRPADSFILDESKPAFVGIRTEKGTVSRKKGKGVNQYRINKGKPLEAFGTNVPKEVQQFLNIEELNFQFQFDAPYWFFISPPEVSRQLNKIVDLEIIDTTLSKIASKARAEGSEVKVSQKRIADYKTQLKQLAFVKPMVKEYDQLFELEMEIKDVSSYFDSMSTGAKEAQRYVLKAETLIQAVTDGHKLIKIGNQYKNKTEEVESLSNIINNLEKDIVLAKAKKPNIKPLNALYNEWKKVNKECNILHRCITETISEKEKVCQKEVELVAKEKRLKKMMGKTCPLCDRAMTKS